MFLPPPPNDGDSANSKAQPPESPVPDEEAHTYALECLLKGSKPAEIRKSLMAQGHSEEQAKSIVRTVQNFRDQHPPAPAGRSANANMLIGGGICLLGLVITIGSWLAASGPGGGRYTIAWGAVVFGAIQFFRGMAQSNQS